MLMYGFIERGSGERESGIWNHHGTIVDELEPVFALVSDAAGGGKKHKLVVG